MSFTVTAPTASPAEQFIRDRLPDLLGITEPPLTYAYDALADMLVDARVFDGLTISDARRTMSAVVQAVLVDTNTAPDAALAVARLAERALAGHGEVDRVAVGLAYVRAAATLLG
ncbi:hypothetical protein BH09ACT8_BH09ACT8_30810 [soil metagenome]